MKRKSECQFKIENKVQKRKRGRERNGKIGVGVGVRVSVRVSVKVRVRVRVRVKVMVRGGGERTGPLACALSLDATTLHLSLETLAMAIRLAAV